MTNGEQDVIQFANEVACTEEWLLRSFLLQGVIYLQTQLVASMSAHTYHKLT